MAHRKRLNWQDPVHQRRLGAGLIGLSLIGLMWYLSLFFGSEPSDSPPPLPSRGGRTATASGPEPKAELKPEPKPVSEAEPKVEPEAEPKLASEPKRGPGSGPERVPVVLDDDFLFGACNDNDSLIKIDPRTGKSAPFGRMGLSDGVEELTMDAKGRIFGALSILPGSLFRLDAESRRGTKIGPFAGVSRTYKVIEAMAVVDGVLYASASSDDSYCGDCANHFVRIDLATGKATEIGLFGPQFLNIEAMAYSPRLGLFGADIGTLIGPDFREFHTRPALVKIDVATGRATRVADLPPRTDVLVPNDANKKMSPYGPFVCGMAFAPDDTLYATTYPTHFGGESHLVRINPETAAVAEVGTLGVKNIDGIVYISASQSRPK